MVRDNADLLKIAEAGAEKRKSAPAMIQSRGGRILDWQRQFEKGGENSNRQDMKG